MIRQRLMNKWSKWKVTPWAEIKLLFYAWHLILSLSYSDTKFNKIIRIQQCYDLEVSLPLLWVNLESVMLWIEENIRWSSGQIESCPKNLTREKNRSMCRKTTKMISFTLCGVLTPLNIIIGNYTAKSTHLMLELVVQQKESL